MMTTAVATPGMDRLRRRQRGRVAQIRGEHQNERRDDTESEKRVQGRQDAAKISGRMAR